MESIQNLQIITRQNLESLSKNQLIELILSLIQKIQALEEKVAVLSKDSSTSSKPPSSDIVKPLEERFTRNPQKDRWPERSPWNYSQSIQRTGNRTYRRV